MDAIIVAGDIFDTGSPPSYARELYKSLLVVNFHSKWAVIRWCWPVIAPSVATLNESRDIPAFLNTTVIASVQGAPRLLHRRDGSPGAVLCPIPFAPARHYYQSGGLSGARTAASNFFMRLPIIINSSIRKRACYAANESAGYRDGTFNHRRRQQKRCGSRHLYRYADAFRRSISSGLYRIRTHIHRAQCVGGTEHIRYCGRPSPSALMSAAKAKCVHLVTDRGKWQSTESLAVPCTQPLAVLKATGINTEQFEQWRGVEQSPPSGWILKSPPMTICTISNAE